MNAVEIAEAISELAAAPFDADEFPFAFLRAFGNKETAIKRLMKGSTNSSDIEGGVLQRSNIHIATCALGQTSKTLKLLRESPKTQKGRVKFILATDGDYVEAEELATGEARSLQYQDLAKQFGFFLPLAGISTTKAIENAEIDIKATGRLNKLYIALIEENECRPSATMGHLTGLA